MHFTGMLAASLPIEVTYDLPLTALSLALPICASTAGLYIIRPLSIGPFQIAAAGTTTGLGIVAMHYTGMAAMRAQAEMAYLSSGFALSIVVRALRLDRGVLVRETFQRREQTGAAARRRHRYGIDHGLRHFEHALHRHGRHGGRRSPGPGPRSPVLA